MVDFNEFMKDGWSYPKKHSEGSADPEVIEQSVNKYFEKNPPTNYITPQMFGAVADGTTDDSEAIQKAINEAQNGATLFFPKGVYAISKGLVTSNKDLNIKGERIGRYIGKNDALTEKWGSIIKYIGTSDATLITQGSSDWNLTISDIILYSDSCEFTDNGLDDDTIPYAQYSIEKEDIVVNGIKTIQTSSMRGVAVVGMSGYGLSPAKAMNVMDCTFYACNRCIQVDKNDLMLRNCYLTASGTAIYCVGSRNIIISDCYMDLLAEYGIYCENYLSGSITDTYIDHSNYAAVYAKGAFNNLNLDVYCGRNAVYYAGSALTDLKNTTAATELENMAFGAAICANLVFKSQLKIHAIERPVDDAGKSSKNAPTIGLYIQQLRSGIIEGVQLKSYIRNTSNTTEPVSINANGIISSVYKNREYNKVGMYIATYAPQSTHIASQVGDLWLYGEKLYIAVAKTDTSTTWALANEVDESQIQSIINSYVEENISSLKGEKGDPGENGVTPHIGENGNWFIGDVDTGQPAGGSGGTSLALAQVLKRQNTKNACIVTFIDDDGKTNAYSKLFNLFKTKECVGDFAINGKFIGTTGYITLDQLKEMQEAGCGIVCHGWAHENKKADSIYSPVSAYKEYSWYDSSYFKDNGFRKDKNNIIVYPGGFNGDLTNNIYSNYYDYGVKASGGGLNVFPINTWNLSRYFLNGSSNDTLVALEAMKNVVDDAIEKGAWLIFGSHSWCLSDSDISIIGELIDYIKEKGISIKTSYDALSVKGYSQRYGYYDMDNVYHDTFMISEEGNMKQIFVSDISIQCSRISLPNISVISTPISIKGILEPSTCEHKIHYWVNDTSIATISDDGILTPIKDGSITVFAYCDNHITSKNYTIELQTVICTGVSLDNNSLVFDSQDTQTLTATIEPGDCTQSITWSTSDSSIATVTDGVVAPKSKGSCIITVTCGDFSATCDVTVNIENSEQSYTKKDIEWASGGYTTTYDGTAYNSYSSGFYTPNWFWCNSSSNLYINNVKGTYLFVDYCDSSAITIGVQVIQTSGISKLEIPEGTARLKIAVRSNTGVTSSTISEVVQLLSSK